MTSSALLQLLGGGGPAAPGTAAPRPCVPALLTRVSAFFCSFQIVYRENALFPEIDPERHVYDLKPDSLLASPPKMLSCPLSQLPSTALVTAAWSPFVSASPSPSLGAP